MGEPPNVTRVPARWRPLDHIERDFPGVHAELLAFVQMGAVAMGRLGSTLLVDEVGLLSCVRLLSAREAADLIAGWSITSTPSDELTLTQAAAIMGVASRTLRQEIHARRLPAIRKGKGKRAGYRILRADLQRALPSQRPDTKMVFDICDKDILQRQSGSRNQST